MTVSIHSRAYRLLQGTPAINNASCDEKLTRLQGPCLRSDEDRRVSKDSNSYSQRSVSPLSVTEIHEEIHTSGSSSTFLDEPQRPCTFKSCVTSKSKAKKPRRRVHFPTSPVTHVKTRPRTLPQDVRRLFYSSAEMSMFRRNYYAYMKSQRAKEVCEVEEETISVDSSDKSQPFLNQANNPNVESPWQIVKAVVSHQGETHEYYHQSSCTSQAITEGSSDNFSFDNPEFWNGEITWF